MKTVWIDETAYRARAVILSTGSAWRPLGVPGEQELLGHGVSSCATCDGFFFRGQQIAVVGGGDSAMEEATFLTKFAESVTIVHRRDSFRASKIMAERALSNPKIKVEWNSVVTEVLDGGGKVGGVRLTDTVDRRFERAAASAACSSRSATTRAASFSAVRFRSTRTGTYSSRRPARAPSVAGVFAAGDLVDHTYRQAITAAGTGCAAALDAERSSLALAWTAEYERCR